MTNNRQFRVARPIRFIHAQLQLAPFSYSYAAWADASYALGTVSANPGFNYVFKIPVPVASDTFVPVIRWNVGATYYRYKLWSTGTEIVPFGLYGGEKILFANDPVIEIWNVQGELTAEMSAAWNLNIGLLVEPTSLSDQTPTIYPG